MPRNNSGGAKSSKTAGLDAITSAVADGRVTAPIAATAEPIREAPAPDPFQCGWNDPSSRTDAVFENPRKPVDELLHLQLEPGLGLSVHEADMAKRRVPIGETPGAPPAPFPLAAFRIADKVRTAMTALPTSIDRRSEAFRVNAAAMRALVDDLREKAAAIATLAPLVAAIAPQVQHLLH